MGDEGLPFITRSMLDFRHGMTVQLQVQTQSNEASAIQIVGATKAGTFTFQHTPTNDSAVTTERFNLPDLPIWVSVVDGNNSLSSGQCHVVLSLRIAGTTVAQLAAGYVFGSKGISWPIGNFENSLPTKGLYRFFQGAGPAAGAEAQVTIPANRWWRVMLIAFTMTTDATVASRRLFIRYETDGTDEIASFFAATTQAASLTRSYHCAQFSGGIPQDGATMNHIALPHDLILPPAFTINIGWETQDAGDQLSAPFIIVEEFPGPAAASA